jgi:hypothetical protein
MIEIKEIEGSPFDELHIDGRRVDAEVRDGFQIRLRDTTATELFMSKRISDFNPRVLFLRSFPRMLEWWKASEERNHIVIARTNKPNECRLSLALSTSASHWNRLWTFSDYKTELKTIAASRGFAGMYFEVNLPGQIAVLESEWSLDVHFDVDVRDTIGDQITRCSEILREIHQDAEKSLSSKLRADSVVMYFDFPGQVRIACEQYLLYFVQFLHELGIDAAAELKHDPGGILFAVTPATAQDALDKVRLALEIYLRLPSGSIKDASTTDGIEIQRLAANIHHLKGQLALASAIIQTKDATIETQRITIEHQLRLSSGEIVLDSLKVSNEPPGATDKEEIVDGIFSITKYQGKGFELNLAEIVRRLKELFHRE